MKIKSLIVKELNKSIEDKKISIQEILLDTIDSRDSDNKSSAGDKHETSRALIQIELEKLSNQLKKALREKNELNNLISLNNSKKVGKGSLVVEGKKPNVAT